MGKLKHEFDIIEITKKQAKELIDKYHYLGNKGFRSKISFGLFHKESEEIVGVAVYHNVSAPETVVGAFGLQRNEQDGILELGRLVMKPEYNGGNYTSFLVANSIKLLRKKCNVRALIAYATSDRHVGYIYQATNFKYYGLTAPKKDFWVDGKIQERGSTKGKKGIWVNRPRKHRYVLIFDKTLKIRWEEQPYPKEQPSNLKCYGCDGKGFVVSRGEKYNCPICQGNMNKIDEQNDKNEAVLIKDFDDALIQITETENKGKVAVYDAQKCIEILMQDGLSLEEAKEYFDYNIKNIRLNKNEPRFIHTV